MPLCYISCDFFGDYFVTVLSVGWTDYEETLLSGKCNLIKEGICPPKQHWANKDRAMGFYAGVLSPVKVFKSGSGK